MDSEGMNMHWLVVDETNKNSKPGQFFIIGGLVFEGDQHIRTHEALEMIRIEHGYRAGDQFKFDSNTRPAHVPIETALEAKKAVVSVLGDIGVRMLTYVILHDIAAKKSEQERMQMGLNTIAVNYNKLLMMEAAQGCMIIDRDDRQHAHLANLFQHGVITNGASFKLQRIKFYGMTSDNASHLSSAVDIALGGFRYCVNAASKDASENKPIVESIFKPLSKLLWGVEEGDIRRIGGYGYITRPASVKVPAYKALYGSLAGKLAEYSNSTTVGSGEESS